MTLTLRTPVAFARPFSRTSYVHTQDLGFAVLRTVREQVQNTPPVPLICGPDDIGALCVAMGMGHWDVEVFCVALLDPQYALIGRGLVEITRGLLDATLIHPREVFKQAIVQGAKSIIVVHNHPGGSAGPSGEDRAATAQLVAAGDLLSIPVRDHLIIAGHTWYSMADAGDIPRQR